MLLPEWLSVLCMAHRRTRPQSRPLPPTRDKGRRHPQRPHQFPSALDRGPALARRATTVAAPLRGTLVPANPSSSGVPKPDPSGVSPTPSGPAQTAPKRSLGLNKMRAMPPVLVQQLAGAPSANAAPRGSTGPPTSGVPPTLSEPIGLGPQAPTVSAALAQPPPVPIQRLAGAPPTNISHSRLADPLPQECPQRHPGPPNMRRAHQWHP
jgi:hypothetical protein